jgi:hypothetical protein
MTLDPHGHELTSLLLGIEAGAGQPELYELEADENLLRVPWPEKKTSGGFSVTRKDLGPEAILAIRKIRLAVLARLINLLVPSAIFFSRYRSNLQRLLKIVKIEFHFFKFF